MSVYFCDPKKHKTCPGGISCQTLCFLTTNPEYSTDGTELTEEDIRKFEAHRIALARGKDLTDEDMDDEEESRFCPGCGAEMKEAEERMICAVQQAVGYKVDKDELIKALRYDRNQYEKGFKDGAEQKAKWIPVRKMMPEDGQIVLFCDIEDDIMLGYHIKGRPDTHFSQDGTFDDIKNVKAWMPLPEPYVAESEAEE